MTTDPATLISCAGRLTASVALVFAITALPPVASPNVSRVLSAQPGPTLVLEDSVILRETDDHPVGAHSGDADHLFQQADRGFQAKPITLEERRSIGTLGVGG